MPYEKINYTNVNEKQSKTVSGITSVNTDG